MGGTNPQHQQVGKGDADLFLPLLFHSAGTTTDIQGVKNEWRVACGILLLPEYWPCHQKRRFIAALLYGADDAGLAVVRVCGARNAIDFLRY